MVRADRTSNNGGGCAILIKENIKFKLIKIVNLIHIEVCAIQIFDEGKNEDLVVISLYNNNGNNNLTADLNTLFRQINRQKCIIGGDFNAKHPYWKNDYTNEAGKSLKKWTDEDGYLLDINHLTTFYPTRERSYIDFFLVSNRIAIEYRDNHPLYLKIVPSFSDHAAVELIVLDSKLERKSAEVRLDFKSTNIVEYQSKITELLNGEEIEDERNLTNEEIEVVAGKIKEVFNRTIEEVVPKIEVKEHGLIELDRITIKLIKLKKRLSRRLFRTQNSDIRTQIKMLDKLIQEQISITYKKYWTTKFKNIKMNKDTFKEIKKLAGVTKKQNIPTLTYQGSEYEQTIDKTNLLADFWENTYQTITTQTNFDIGNLNLSNHNYSLFNFRPGRKSSMQGSIEDEDEDTYRQFMNMEELEGILKSRNNKLSAGNDTIPMYLLKKIPVEMKRWLVVLFNNVYNNAYIPEDWKEAKQKPLLKPGKDAQLPESYRMISLLSNISKVYEVFVHSKIERHMENNGIYEDHQFGFRKGHSTTHALSILAKDLTNGLNRRYGTIAVGLDLEKAFDKAWHEGILFKMKNIFSFSDHICRVTQNYLENRTFRVAIDEQLSSKRIIRAGVPQGSVLGPVLYNIYTMDVPKPAGEDTKMLAYADDLLIYATRSRLSIAETKINEHLQEIAEYMDKWKLKLNLNKCEVIKVVTPDCYRSAKRLVPKVKINNVLLKVVKNMKYLGYNINEKHTTNKHVSNIIKKCNASLNLYSKAINHKTRLNPKIKGIFYKQVIRPALAYGFPAFTHITPTMMEEIRKLERKCLRHATGLHRKDGYKYYKNKEVYDSAKIIRIDNFMTKFALNFLDKCGSSENGKIRELTRQHITSEDKYKGIQHFKLLHEEGQLYDENRIKYYNGRFDASQYI
jgi:hypothetical protein